MNPLARAWNSLHARLLVGAALWVIAALALSDLAISTLFRQHVTSQFLHELSDHVSELQGVIHVGADGRIQFVRPLSDPRFMAEGSGFYWEIADRNGVRLKSPSLGGRALPLTQGPAPPEAGSRPAGPAGGPLLMIERDLPGAGLRLAVAAEQAQLEAVLQRFTRLLRISLSLLAAGLIAAAVAQVVIGLRPMRRLREKLAEVRTGRADRLPEDFPSEVRPLVSDLNALIESNREMVRRARAQAGNLAHALKGPLAILTDEAERLAQAGDRAAAEVLRRQCEAMSRQIDHQLARSRAAATRAGGLGASASPSEAAGEILSAMARLYAGRALAFDNALGPDLMVACDPQDLQEMLANLVDNAAKWAKGQVRLREAPAERPGMAAILVEDDGPGVAPEKRDAVFAIGERLDEQKPGAGLGLPIVRELAELYGGGVRLDRSPLGGLSAVLELPRASD